MTTEQLIEIVKAAPADTEVLVQIDRESLDIAAGCVFFVESIDMAVEPGDTVAVAVAVTLNCGQGKSSGGGKRAGDGNRK